MRFEIPGQAGALLALCCADFEVNFNVAALVVAIFSLLVAVL